MSQLSYFQRAMESKFAENLSLISHLNFRMSDIVGGKIVKDNEVELKFCFPEPMLQISKVFVVTNR